MSICPRSVYNYLFFYYLQDIIVMRFAVNDIYNFERLKTKVNMAECLIFENDHHL